MRQIEARNAVKRIQKKLLALYEMTDLGDVHSRKLSEVIYDVNDLENRLTERKQATPNCRPATPDELRQLCAASNVVMFPAA